MDRHPQIVSLLYGQPWSIERETFDELRDILELSARGRITDDHVRARISAPSRPDSGVFDPEAEAFFWAAADGSFRAAAGEPLRTGRQVVAVLGVYGVIVPRASFISELFGMTSSERIARNLRAFVADPDVTAILLDVDSPGGVTVGATELAAEIRAARQQKPVHAIANHHALSLGYWLAAQGSEVIATPSAHLGSVGVFVEHADHSEQLAKEGIKVSLVSYGANKTLGNPYEPLSDAARAEMQKHVTEIGQTFERDVAQGRGISPAKVHKDFGQGLRFNAKESIERGLADRVGTIDDAVRRLAKTGGKVAGAPKATGFDQATPGQDRTAVLEHRADGGVREIEGDERTTILDLMREWS